MVLKTSLYEQHIALKAKMADFHGWSMPFSYGSEIAEHLSVRQNIGMFDISHMTIIDIKGDQAKEFLRYLLANDVDKLKIDGAALYSLMLNEEGGVVDDLIVYRVVEKSHYRIVANASTCAKDLAWIKNGAEKNGYDILIEHRKDLAMIAVQGPKALAKTRAVFTKKQKEATRGLQRMQGIAFERWWIARTGYSGEDGYEIMLPEKDAQAFWEKLLKKGVTPCGLIARDSLRLEVAYSLYGQEMDETITPFESNLGWTVAWEPKERNFLGREALEKKRSRMKKKLLGIILEKRGVLRNKQKVVVKDLGGGEITSGGYSPILQCGIALARLPKKAKIGSCAEVLVRGKWLSVKIVKPPFVKKI